MSESILELPWIKSNLKSAVWQYFWHHVKENKAKCKTCAQVISFSGTSSLRYHVEKKHKIDLQDNPDIIVQPKSHQPTIKQAFAMRSQEDLNLVISRMCSVSRISFNQIAKDYDIRLGLEARGFRVPKSVSSVSKIVSEFAEKVRSSMRDEIQRYKSNEKKFSKTVKQQKFVQNYLKRFTKPC